VPDAGITDWLSEPVAYDDAWEAAYLRFETPEEETAKFLKRLCGLGAAAWPRSARIMELFCGRGNGLKALELLGFTSTEGVDLSLNLLRRYDGPARLYRGDCRALLCEDESRDTILIHGGLHHLAVLPDDLEQVLRESHRVLKAGGVFAFVEPWLTPFLRLVHAACRLPAARTFWLKLDALADMIEKESTAYYRWLAAPEAIDHLVDKYFVTTRRTATWGKLMFMGKKR